MFHCTPSASATISWWIKDLYMNRSYPEPFVTVHRRSRVWMAYGTNSLYRVQIVRKRTVQTNPDKTQKNVQPPDLSTKNYLPLIVIHPTQISLITLQFPHFTFCFYQVFTQYVFAHLYLGLHIFNCVTWLHLERDRLSRQRFHKDLHFATTVQKSRTIQFCR